MTTHATKRTMAHLRSRGYATWSVEKYVHRKGFGGFRVDAFNLFDVLAIPSWDDEHVYPMLVQCCASGGDLMKHVRKLEQDPGLFDTLADLLDRRNIYCYWVAWRKLRPRDDDGSFKVNQKTGERYKPRWEPRWVHAVKSGAKGEIVFLEENYEELCRLRKDPAQGTVEVVLGRVQEGDLEP